MIMTQFIEYTPLEYLMIDIASNYGEYEGYDLEKQNFEDRIAWFKEQEKAGSLVKLIDTADEQPLYFAGLQAYRDFLDRNPTGYAISLDACASGLQILSSFANCERSARRCGIVPTGSREDAYTSLFDDMRARSTTTLNATRKSLKQAIMTSLYGSTAQPKNLFGQGTPALQLFYDIMESEIPGAWNLNLMLKALWQPYATQHSWTLPDGFNVCMDVESVQSTEIVFNSQPVQVFTKKLKGTPTGRSLSPNIVHSVDGMIVREMTRRCMHDSRQIERTSIACKIAMKRKTKRSSTTGKGRKKDITLERIWSRFLASGFLSVRVIDLIDENNVGMICPYQVMGLIDTLPPEPFPLLSIHDCFKCHPNYGNSLRRQYNQILSNLAASDVLGDIATQITGTKVKLSKLGDISKFILDANYSLS